MSFRQHRFHVLDGMRGIAAIVVMIGHYYDVFSLAPGKSAYLQSTFLAVDFFFIMSGFVICHAYGKRLEDSRVSSSEYIARRIARLFPLMASAIIIGLPSFCFYGLSRGSNFSGSNIFTATALNVFFIPYINNRTIPFALNVETGLIFPSDVAMWSIFFEMIASLSFIFFIRQKKHLWLYVLVSYLYFVDMAFCGDHFNINLGWVAGNFLGGFPRVFYGFTCGMLLYGLRMQSPSFPFLRWIQNTRSINPLILYAVLIAALLFPFHTNGVYDLVFIALIAPMLILQGGKATCEDRVLRKTSEFLGWLSYPLYCLHMPVLYGVFMIREKTGFLTEIGIPYQIIAIIGSLLLAGGVAYSFDRLKVQKKLGNFLTAAFERVF